MFWGGILQPQSGIDVALNGPVQAQSRRIFDLSAGGVISGTPQVETASVTWWGADPSGNEYSADAINAAIAFCAGLYKPMLTHPAGRYMCDKRIYKSQSFYMPIIAGTGGGNDKEPGGTSWDFSECKDIGADPDTGEPQPCVVIKGGSGRTSHGGIKDIEIVGNYASTGISVADQCGIFVNNMIVRNCVDGILQHNETGFTEWNKFVGCQVDKPSRYSFNFRRTNGENSFHGAEIIDCWTNLSASSPCAVHVGDGCKWYNGTSRIRVFFSGGLTNYQDVFDVHPNAYDVDTEGYIKTEAGGGWARGANPAGRFVNMAGPVLALTGFTWGNLRPVKYSVSVGPEGGLANGVTVLWLENQSYGPRFITVDENGDWYIGTNAAGSLDMDIIVSASNYEYRLSGIAHQQGYGGDGKFIPTGVWALNNSRGFGEPVLRVDSKHRIILRNAKYPPGEVKFYCWWRQRSLSVQTNQRFATMNP